MDSILRGAVTYLFVWLIFRIAGKRTLSQITTFDAVLLLIISEATEAALVDSDNSMTNTLLLILTIVGIDIGMSYVKQKVPIIERIMDGRPLRILDENGLDRYAMAKERVDEDDILHAGRELQGLASLDDMESAVLEQTGDITIVPKQRNN